LLASVQTEKQRTIALIDGSGQEIAATASAKFAQAKLPDGKAKWVVEVVPVQGTIEATHESLKPRILNKSLYGVVTIGPDIEADGNFKFYGLNVSDIGTMMEIESALHDGVVAERLKKSQLGIDQEKLKDITKRIDMKSNQETATGSVEKGSLQAIFATF